MLARARSGLALVACLLAIAVATPAGADIRFRGSLAAPVHGVDRVETPTLKNPMGARALALADFDNDGRLDIAVAYEPGDRFAPKIAPSIRVMLGKGDGTFDLPVVLPMPSGPGGDPSEVYSVVAGKFDADAFPDIITALPDRSTLLFFKGLGTGQFAAPATTTLTAPTTGLRAVDLDGDTLLDLVGWKDATLMVARNAGNGTFANVQQLTSPSLVAQVEVADLNGDGKLDLVGTNPALGFTQFVIYMNSGSNTFPATPTRVASAGGKTVTGLVIAEVTNDSHLDLIGFGLFGPAPTGCSMGGIVVAGNGNGTFATPTGSDCLEFGYAGANASAAPPTDLDGDGRLDLVVPGFWDSQRGDNLVQVLRRTAAPRGFQVDTYVPLGWQEFGDSPDIQAPTAMVVGDVNTDGRPDLVVASYTTNVFLGPGGVSVLLGQAGGGFRAVRRHALLGGSWFADPQAPAVGDFTGDGKPDLVAIVPGPRPSLLRGRGDGGFDTAGIGPVVAGAIGTVYDARGADMDGDQKPDVAMRTDTGGWQVLYGNGTGGFSALVSGTLGFQRDLAVGDFNADGRRDLAVITGGFIAGGIQTDGVLTVAIGGPNRTFTTSAVSLGSRLTEALAVGDVDGDGRDDAVVAALGQGTPAIDSVRFLRGNPSGTLAAPVDTPGFGCGASALVDAALSDLDGDGKLDLVGVCGVSLLAARGKGDGTFVVPAVAVPVAFAVTTVAVGDLDLDGRPDAVVGTDRAGLWVLAGRGDGTFASPRGLGVGHTNIRTITLADVNADGKPEIIVSVFTVGVAQVGDRVAVLVNESTPFSIQPTSAGNLGRVTLRLTGQDIVSGSSVRLVRLGQPARVPTATNFANGVLTVTVDLTGAEIGAWNVELTPPGGGLPITFTDGLQVEAARVSGLYASIAGPFRVRTFREFDYYVWWTNRGNVDIPSALIDVNVEQGADGSLTLLSAESVGPESVATIVRDGGVSAGSTSRVLRIRTGSIGPGLPIVGAKFRMRGTANATFYLQVNGQELPAFTPPFERRSEPAVTQAEVLAQTANSVDLRLRLSDDPATPLDYGIRWSLVDGYQPPRLTEEATAAGGRITTTTTVYLTADELAAIGLTPPRAGRVTSALVGPGSYSQIVQSWTSTSFDFSTGRMVETWTIRSKNILQEVRRRLEQCLRDFDVPFDADTFEALDNVKAINEFSDALLNVPRNGISREVLTNAAANFLASKASSAMTEEVGASLIGSLMGSSNAAMPQLVRRSLEGFPELTGGESAGLDFITSVVRVPTSTGDLYTKRVNARQQLQQLLIQKLLDLCFRCSEFSIYKDTTQGPNGSCNCPPKKGAPPAPNLCQPPPGGGGGQGGGAGSGGSSSRTPHELSGSFDPNAKYGPGGVGAARYLVPGAPASYTITFENLATATAPAAEVEITDTLDATRLDPATFSLGLITFGGDRVVVPPAGVQSYTTTLDLRPAKPFQLRIEAALSRATNVVRWKFTTLDPATNDVPVDPQIGFLPPNTSPPQGEGAVTFFVAPRTGLASGDTISNGATIVFDANPPIVTPTWTNTVDVTAPTSAVTALPVTTATRDFTVAWTGSDAHSGVATYDVYVAEGNGAFSLWLDDTPAASSTFFGDPGKTYRFYSQAVDRVGNVEAAASTAQATTTVTAPTTATDADGDGLADAWETRFGLSPTTGLGDQGGQGDADGDGFTNDQEEAAGTHPRGFTRRYFAEGATGNFFDTAVALANPTGTAASVLMRFLKADGTAVASTLTLGPTSRTTVDPETLSGMSAAEFATSVESDVPIVADRTMRWPGGSHTERSLPAPAVTWYLAEGATHSGFDLFYLLQNPGSTASEVRVRYLLPSGAPLEKVYTVAPNSRFNIWVDVEEFPAAGGGAFPLAGTDVAAVIDVLNGQPITVERAMYLSKPGQLFASGHESAGVTAPATSWFLAEGATGPYFDLFVLVANPSATAAQVRARYLLTSGQVITKDYTVGANSRFNIWVDFEDPALADAAVSTTIESQNGVPVIVERAMWWPGDASTWFEAHNSPGSTGTGTKWALAEGEVGGARNQETYVLIANTSTTEGLARVTLLFEDGSTTAREFVLAPNSRFNVAVGAEFPAAAGRRFGTIVESIGATPAQIVVERALYGNENGVVWTLGSNALATRLQ